MNKFILNADDFGASKYHNDAVLEGYKTGILTSASLCTNMDGFMDAVQNVIPKCPDLSIGIHLNIMEGGSLTKSPLLADCNGNFYNSYLHLILKQHNKELLCAIENEFRMQIEKALEFGIKIDHLDSHIHTHAIPEIFKIVCRLAQEYNIKNIRTQREIPYIIDCNHKYLINFIKIILLAYFSSKNKKILKDYDLKTNDRTIGIGYTGMMTQSAILSGLKSIKNCNIVEAIIHPCRYQTNAKNSHSMEFEITQDENFKNEVIKLGFTFSNYSIS